MVGTDLTSLNVPAIIESNEITGTEETRSDDTATLLKAGYSHKQAAFIVQWSIEHGQSFARLKKENPFIPENNDEIEAMAKRGIAAKTETPFSAAPTNIAMEEAPGDDEKPIKENAPEEKEAEDQPKRSSLAEAREKLKGNSPKEKE